MSASSTDLAVRKALLQARAEVERIELAGRVADLRESAAPRNLVHQLLPALSGGGQGQRLSSQLSSLHDRYPMIWSGVSWALGRGRLASVFKVAGAALAVRKALRLARR